MAKKDILGQVYTPKTVFLWKTVIFGTSFSKKATENTV